MKMHLKDIWRGNGVKKMNKKPFVVIHDKKNNVILLDNIEKRPLLFLQFNNYKDAEDCRRGLMHICNLMNRNYSLKKLLDDPSIGRLAKENQELKKNLRNLQAYNAACEDTLLNVDVIVHQMLGTAEKEFNKKLTAAKILNGSSSKDHISQTSILLDAVFYWKGYLKAVKDLKNEIFPKDVQK